MTSLEEIKKFVVATQPAFAEHRGEIFDKIMVNLEKILPEADKAIILKRIGEMREELEWRWIYYAASNANQEDAFHITRRCLQIANETYGENLKG